MCKSLTKQWISSTCNLSWWTPGPNSHFLFEPKQLDGFCYPMVGLATWSSIKEAFIEKKILYERRYANKSAKQHPTTEICLPYALRQNQKTHTVRNNQKRLPFPRQKIHSAQGLWKPLPWLHVPWSTDCHRRNMNIGMFCFIEYSFMVVYIF